MASPCPCRGCKAAYEQGREDEREAQYEFQSENWELGYTQAIQDSVSKILEVVQITGSCPDLDEAERRIKELKP